VASGATGVVSQRFALFDLDGCLVDSRSAVAHGVNAALTDAGLAPLTENEVARFIGPPLHAIFDDILTSLRPAPGVNADDLVAAYRKIYGQTKIALTTIVPGIHAALDGLSAAGVQLAVCTSKPEPLAIELLAGLGLLQHFVSVNGPALSVRSEPKQKTLARALRHLRVATGAKDETVDAVMIGDRHHDISAGRANGVATIGVTWGSGDAFELQSAHADIIINDPVKLPLACQHALRLHASLGKATKSSAQML